MPASESLTIDHLHQYAYCPRRMHLMYVDGRWENNAYTEDGRAVHRRTDDEEDTLPEPPSEGAGEPPPDVVKSVMLSSTTLGLIGKPDVIELAGGVAVPVDFKRGAPPDNPYRCYEPERVQLMAQGLLLREHGYQAERGLLYFARARKRVEVTFTPELEERTRYLLRQAHEQAASPDLPPPLEDSPKCVGCSLAGLCLPDEVNFLQRRTTAGPGDVRRLYPARDDALPLYVQDQGARVGKEGDGIVVSKGSAMIGRFPLKDVSQVVLCGNIGCSAQALHLLCESGIPVVHLSMGGWFYGITGGHGLRNAYDRAAQFSAAANEGRCLAFAKAAIRAKIFNQRTLLRRNAAGNVREALRDLRRIGRAVDAALAADALLGVEGSAAAVYFANFPRMLRAEDSGLAFDFGQRNRRPPRDPVNALLSYTYALLAKEATVALMAEGLDPWWGFYHRPRHGRPALALDLMEEFRPLIADSAVLTAINTRMVERKDFVVGASGCAMKPSARKAILRAYEQRLDGFVTHPVFDYRCSWRAVVKLQARLLSRWLRGDVPRYNGMMTR